MTHLMCSTLQATELNKTALINFNNSRAESKLTAKNVDFHNKENRKAHHTDDYDIQQLIVRRGQVFDVTLMFNRDYKPEDDVIVVQLATGIFTLHLLIQLLYLNYIYHLPKGARVFSYTAVIWEEHCIGLESSRSC